MTKLKNLQHIQRLPSIAIGAHDGQATQQGRRDALEPQQASRGAGGFGGHGEKGGLGAGRRERRLGLRKDRPSLGHHSSLWRGQGRSARQPVDDAVSAVITAGIALHQAQTQRSQQSTQIALME